MIIIVKSWYILYTKRSSKKCPSSTTTRTTRRTRTRWTTTRTCCCEYIWSLFCVIHYRITSTRSYNQSCYFITSQLYLSRTCCKSITQCQSHSITRNICNSCSCYHSSSSDSICVQYLMKVCRRWKSKSFTTDSSISEYHLLQSRSIGSQYSCKLFTSFFESRCYFVFSSFLESHSYFILCLILRVLKLSGLDIECVCVYISRFIICSH